MRSRNLLNNSNRNRWKRYKYRISNNIHKRYIEWEILKVEIIAAATNLRTNTATGSGIIPNEAFQMYKEDWWGVY